MITRPELNNRIANYMIKMGKPYEETMAKLMTVQPHDLPNGVWERATTGDVNQLHDILYQPKNPVNEIPTSTAKKGFLGAIKTGYGDTWHTREGYAHYDPSLPTVKEQRNSVEIHPQWGVPVLRDIPTQHDYQTLPEKVGYYTGAIAGDIASNATRHWMWNMSVPEVTSVNLYKWINGTKGGYPAPDIHFDNKGNPHWIKGSAQGAMLGATGAFLGNEALGVISGNYNPLNYQEGMRAAGYSALTPDQDDPRKSEAPALDVIQRYLMGRKGRVLPWQEFHQERPDVSYEKYSAYKNWQQGKDDRDLLGKATLGVAKFNSEGLGGSPELSMMGATVTPLGVAAALGTGLAFRKLNSYLGTKALARFGELDSLASAGELSQGDYAEWVNHPFNRSGAKPTDYQPPANSSSGT